MTNLFETFEGADLDRLAECLKAIKEAGLRCDKYTQAGVNQSSGNVWVFNEDWPGCVYCNIEFDVAWNWSCPYCGEEYDFDTYTEMCDFVESTQEQFEDHCQACSE